MKHPQFHSRRPLKHSGGIPKRAWCQDLGYGEVVKETFPKDRCEIEVQFDICSNTRIKYSFKQSESGYVLDDFDKDKRDKLVIRKNIMAQTKKIANKITQQKIKSSFDSDHFLLDENDCKLICLWRKKPEDNDPEDNDKELDRLKSARIAEKAAIKFYQTYLKDEDVKDVSKTQLDGEGKEWKDYDLKVGNDKIDVKNARREGSEMTRHHVQRKFEERTALNGIIICGIVSPWDMEGCIEYIGETSIKRINELKEAFKNTTVIKIDKALDVSTSYSNAFYPNGRTDSRVFPPWIFDYPDYVYRERTEALKDFRATVEEHKQVVKEMLEEMPELLPIMAAAGVEIPVTGDETQKVIFADKLANKVREHGLSLPIIYLTVLCHFLDMARSDSPGWDGPKALYKQCLFIHDAQRNPLGIYDPLRVISGLIEVLEQLWNDGGKNHIGEFKAFNLDNFNILRGEKDSSEWKTLVAYCGNCGKYPLVIEPDEKNSCKGEQCGKLICECGYCSKVRSISRTLLPCPEIAIRALISDQGSTFRTFPEQIESKKINKRSVFRILRKVPYYKYEKGQKLEDVIEAAMKQLFGEDGYQEVEGERIEITEKGLDTWKRTSSEVQS